MKRNSQTFVLVVLAGLVLTSLTGARLFAQEPGEGGLEIVELSGKLDMILGNQIKLKSENGEESVVLVGSDTTFAYQGTAEPTALSAGLMVRFTAAFDAAGTPQAPLAELEVFTPVRVRRMSLEMRQSQTPGIYPATDEGQEQTGKGQGADNRKAPGNVATSKPVPGNTPQVRTPPAANPRDKSGKGNGPPAAAGAVQDYLVVGMLRAIQGDKLQIFAGNRPLILQADPGLKITVSAGDPTFCQPGDEIKLTGLKSPAGLIQADTIEVTGAKPLGSVDEKAQSRKKRSKPGEKEEAGTKANANEKAKTK